MESLGTLGRLPPEWRDKIYGTFLLADEVATGPNEYGLRRYRFETTVCCASRQVCSEARKVLHEGNTFISITTNRSEFRHYMERFGISYYFRGRPQNLKTPLRVHVRFPANMVPMPFGFITSNEFSILAQDLEAFTRILRCFDISTTIHPPPSAGVRYSIRLEGVEGELRTLSSQAKLLEPFRKLWSPFQLAQMGGQMDSAYGQEISAAMTCADPKSYINTWEPYKCACWLKYAADRLFRAADWGKVIQHYNDIMLFLDRCYAVQRQPVLNSQAYYCHEAFKVISFLNKCVAMLKLGNFYVLRVLYSDPINLEALKNRKLITEFHVSLWAFYEGLMWGMLGWPLPAWMLFDRAVHACPYKERFVDARLAAASWAHRFALLDTDAVRHDMAVDCSMWIEELPSEPLLVFKAPRE